MTRTALLAVRILLSTVTFANAGSLGRPCTSTPQNQWLSLDVLQAKVEALGYKVQKAKLKAACGELYTIGRNGSRGRIVRRSDLRRHRRQAVVSRL